MANPLSYRVCGPCSEANDQYPISELFQKTPFKCKLCNERFIDGVYILMAHDSEDNVTYKPDMFIGSRGTGKTTWLINKIGEYESVSTHNQFMVMVGHGMRELHRVAKLIASEQGFLLGTHYQGLTHNSNPKQWMTYLNLHEYNLYVDEIQMLPESLVAEIANLAASGRIRRLFFTKNETALDVLMRHSFTHQPKIRAIK